MAEVNWNMLLAAPNPGAAFATSFQQGIHDRQQNALAQQQMKEHQEDRQLRVQQMQSEAARAQLEQHRDSIITGAKIIRQVQPQDDASWQQAKQLFVQMGGDPTDIPDHFDPQYAQNIVKLADALAPDQPQGTASQQDYQFARQQGFNGSYTDFLQYIHPPSALTIPYNSTVTMPGQQGAPAPVLTDDQMRQMLNGGQTGSAPSGGF